MRMGLIVTVRRVLRWAFLTRTGLIVTVWWCPQMGVPHEDEHGEEDDEDMGVVETYADYMPAKRERHQRPRTGSENTGNYPQAFGASCCFLRGILGSPVSLNDVQRYPSLLLLSVCSPLFQSRLFWCN